ncbi:MAG: translesion error-prone DNA polymerase V autoproteolytic subunit [Bacteroidaceae bacterium]|nr:translesion error-prone DNA polymerase V autoproteolytic subunit [Bacteroidaceae bacterium]
MSSDIKILQSQFTQAQSLQLAPGIKAGFPSPATDYLRDSLDFNRDLIRNPEATFFGRVVGDSMIGAGLDDGDLAVIDRSLEPNNGDIIVAYINNEFTIKTLDLSHRSQGYIELLPANPTYKPIRITDTDSFMVWGVVVYTIKTWRKY